MRNEALERASRISAIGYVVGTYALIPGCTLMLKALDRYYEIGIIVLVGATMTILFASLIDLWIAIRSRPSPPSPPAERLLESAEPYRVPARRTRFSLLIVPVLMVQGGLLFTSGSMLYLPIVGMDRTGLWIFRTGSWSYFAAGCLSLAKLAKDGGLASNVRSLIGIISFLIGSCLYSLGGVLSQMDKPGFAECWIVGSALFAIGASLSAWRLQKP